MAKFDESKIINVLHKDRAEVGKKYWFSDDILNLKDYVENNIENAVFELIKIDDTRCRYPFCSKNDRLSLLYPYEEPPKKRMTHRQLAEWLSKGCGEFSENGYTHAYLQFSYIKGSEENKEVDESKVIRSWGSDKWIEPIVDIYERDCK